MHVKEEENGRRKRGKWGVAFQPQGGVAALLLGLAPLMHPHSSSSHLYLYRSPHRAAAGVPGGIS